MPATRAQCQGAETGEPIRRIGLHPAPAIFNGTAAPPPSAVAPGKDWRRGRCGGLPPTDNPDFGIVGPGWVAVLVFSALVLVHGMLVALPCP